MDRHRLYEQAVQQVDFEVDQVDALFRRLRGRTPATLREDFCGTAAMACEWVRRGPERRAVGVDLDARVLDWARRHNVASLGEAARRVRLIRGDVRGVRAGRFDVIVAYNFSYWVFRTREVMRDYFRRVRRALKPDGLFLLDAYGGYEAYEERVERRRERGFVFEWEQARYNPVDGSMRTYIHFELPGGRRMERAFRYDWRLWSLPELRELLGEAGFARTRVWTDPDDDGRHRFVERLDADACWIAYLVAEPRATSTVAQRPC
ncbi:MAG: methyltransferase domain-containing protein [Myxococcota bacterium]|nr:methyltransferase domain-containing protein [Myxococcota bacterium]